MDISELTIKIIFILLPGGLTCLIIENLTIHQKTWTPFRFIFYSILAGGVSYSILDILKVIFKSSPVEIWEKVTNGETIPFSDIGYACIIGVIIGFLISALIQHKLLFKFAKCCRISRKYGDDNLYTHLLNSRDINEIYIKDISNNLVYHGIVESYSENDLEKEIILMNVDVYRYEDSALLYSRDRIYLNLKSEVKIEISNQPEQLKKQ